MYLWRLCLNVPRVEAVLMLKGRLFHIIAPEYWKDFLKSSLLCFGIDNCWFDEDRKPYETLHQFLTITDLDLITEFDFFVP